MGAQQQGRGVHFRLYDSILVGAVLLPLIVAIYDMRPNEVLAMLPLAGLLCARMIVPSKKEAMPPTALLAATAAPAVPTELAKTVLTIRRWRFTEMGLDEEEIEELCNLELYPGTVDEELRQLSAYRKAVELSRSLQNN